MIVSSQSTVYESKKGEKDKELIQSSTTPDPGYHMGMTKIQLNTTNKSQKVSPFPAGDHKAAMNRRESMTNTSRKHFSGGLKTVSQRQPHP